MEETECEVIQLNDYRLVLCDCCLSPVRRRELSLVSRHGYEDAAEICTDCTIKHFDEEQYKIIKKGR